MSQHRKGYFDKVTNVLASQTTHFMNIKYSVLYFTFLKRKIRAERQKYFVKNIKGFRIYPNKLKRRLSVQTRSLPVCQCCIYLDGIRSEEHTSELQSRFDLVCRLPLEKKKHMQK